MNVLLSSKLNRALGMGAGDLISAFLDSFYWKLQRHSQSASSAVRNGNVSTVCARNCACDSKAQTTSSMLYAARGIKSNVWFEYPFSFLRRDAWTIVIDMYLHLAKSLFNIDRNPFSCMTPGVVNQVCEAASDCLRVNLNRILNAPMNFD
jgi:hypothetical protein